MTHTPTPAHQPGMTGGSMDEPIKCTSRCYPATRNGSHSPSCQANRERIEAALTAHRHEEA